eukprot:11711250-Ditylum_brightwellii.AAC.1
MSGGEDNKGLGRWSHVQIAGKDQKKVMLVTVYKPCVQTKEGDSTVTAQHKQILTMQEDTNVSPWKAFNQDLLEEIRKWRNEGNTVVLGIDANRDVKEAELSEFPAEAKMYNLMQAKHGIHSPNTHIKGSHAVDFLFVTEDVIDPIEEIGMFPFGEGINSDHRGFFINIDQHFLLSGE